MSLGAWSQSGNDIYYDEGKVHVGGAIAPDLSGALNVAGQVTMMNDTFYNQFPKILFLLRTDSFIINEQINTTNPIIGMGMIDTLSDQSSLDTVDVHFTVERFEDFGMLSTWVYERNDSLITTMVLGPDGIGINTFNEDLDTELNVNGNIKQKIFTEDVSNPPTITQLNGLFGNASANGAGWTGYLKDEDSDYFYQVVAVYNGSSYDWHTFASTKAQ